MYAFVCVCVSSMIGVSFLANKLVTCTLLPCRRLQSRVVVFFRISRPTSSCLAWRVMHRHRSIPCRRRFGTLYEIDENSGKKETKQKKKEETKNILPTLTSGLDP